MDKTKNKFTGDCGEDMAADFLKSIGYRILGRNLRYDFGEIDILAEAPNKTIVIVEVKTVSGSGWGQASDLIRWRKKQKLKQLAQAVAQEYRDYDIRIDAIGIDNGKITHLPNAVWE